MIYRGRTDERPRGDLEWWIEHCGRVTVLVEAEIVWHCHRDAPPLTERWQTRPDARVLGLDMDETDRGGRHWRDKRLGHPASAATAGVRPARSPRRNP